MNKVILHIGSHKTGTSSIQKALYLHRHQLRSAGVNPFLEVRNGKEQSSNLGIYFANNTGRNCNFEHTGALLKGEFFDDVKARTDNKYPTTIISSEEFSFITSKDELNRLKSCLLSIFDDIEILVYLRRQDKQLISHHQQSSRAPGAVTYIYGNEPVAMPSFSTTLDCYLDYYERLSLWADVFDQDNIKIVNFNRNFLYKEGIVSDFFYRVGSNLVVDEIHENVSLGKKTTKLKHLSMKVGFTREESLIFNSIFSVDKDKMLPSKENVMLLLDKYESSNKKLISKFKLNPRELFETEINYPEFDNSAWSEDESNEVIMELLRLLLKMIREEQD